MHFFKQEITAPLSNSCLSLMLRQAKAYYATKLGDQTRDKRNTLYHLVPAGFHKRVPLFLDIIR